MANWLRTLDVADAWDAVGDDETKIVDLCKVVVSKLNALDPFADTDIEDEKVELVHQFEEMIDTDCQDFNDFNYTWECLYDWADQTYFFNGERGKVCWVKIT